MTVDTSEIVIDDIMASKPEECDGIDVGFIGGEPLLAFDIIKHACEYAWIKYPNEDIVFYASTNGTVLTDEMKIWFVTNKNRFKLGVSLDGTRDVHNHNRSNSFDKIDIPFFVENWPNQGTKMTISEYSINSLADSIIYLHSIGFRVYGSNLAEGYIDWDKDEYLFILSRELKKLVTYYIENPHIEPCQMLNRELWFCDMKHEKEKCCGIGHGAVFYDIDGKKYPCPYITPMTFTKEEIESILKIDYTDHTLFVDNECFNSCYIYPMCSVCSGNNYKATGSFSKWDKNKCRINELVSLYVAEMWAQKIIKKQVKLSDNELFHLINAISRIEKEYKSKYLKYL